MSLSDDAVFLREISSLRFDEEGSISKYLVLASLGELDILNMYFQFIFSAPGGPEFMDGHHLAISLCLLADMLESEDVHSRVLKSERDQFRRWLITQFRIAKAER